MARQAGLKAGLPVSVPGETVNRVCGSGLQAVVHAVEAIHVGYVDTMVAGGRLQLAHCGTSDGCGRTTTRACLTLASAADRTVCSHCAKIAGSSGDAWAEPR